MQKVHMEYIDSMGEYKRRCSELYNSRPYDDKMAQEMLEIYDTVIEPKRRAYESIQTLRLLKVSFTPVEEKER
jgi:hypothetical protein